MGVIALAAAGDSVFGSLGITPPSFYPALKENRWTAGIAAWIVGNIVSANLLNTGAFEIKYGDRVVFSKLQQGRMPSVKEVLDGLQREMELHLDENIHDYAV
uniref:Selenoprotein T n=1 Tax=Lotharella oceanica TaxID=641309 RepID=A0A7S2TTQ7_9EUKA|mmetsp:Transcript_26993/g.50409  ORF Transcript_26993/g.50409 Transcript_26993/m.50409 type:complete len:102 (+) Transcript_26993:354-659(+)